MDRILIESHPIPFDAFGFDHLYLVYDANNVADTNDIVTRGGPDSIFNDIALQVSVPIEF